MLKPNGFDGFKEENNSVYLYRRKRDQYLRVLVSWFDNDVCGVEITPIISSS